MRNSWRIKSTRRVSPAKEEMHDVIYEIYENSMPDSSFDRCRTSLLATSSLGEPCSCTNAKSRNRRSSIRLLQHRDGGSDRRTFLETILCRRGKGSCAKGKSELRVGSKFVSVSSPN